MEFHKEKYPGLPGVYLMKGKDGTVIYVGKANSLRARLTQYFSKEISKDISGKTKFLVLQIESIDFVVVKNENEALVLESNMIKNYMPKYNIALKDAKHFSQGFSQGEKALRR